MIYIFRINVTGQKHWLVLITLLLGFSIPLIGCSSLTTRLSNQSTPTTAVPTSTDSSTSPDTVTPIDSANPTNKTNSSVTVDPTATNPTPSKSQNVSQSVKTATPASPTKASERINTVVISKAKYNQLEYGYTYEKVKGFLGDTGKVITESGIKGSKGYAVTYLYHTKSPSDGEVFLAFKDDKLVNKMEVNLQ